MYVGLPGLPIFPAAISVTLLPFKWALLILLNRLLIQNMYPRLQINTKVKITSNFKSHNNTFTHTYV